MRNLKRLQLEIKMLEGVFGRNNISYPSDGRWIKIENYRLPKSIYRYTIKAITLLIIIPESYGCVGISKVYIDMGLKIYRHGRMQNLPHAHRTEYEDEGYRWLCFEPANVFVSLLNFVNTLRTYFTDPFKYQEL